MTDREIVELACAHLAALGNLARDPKLAHSLFRRARELLLDRATVLGVNISNTPTQKLPPNAPR